MTNCNVKFIFISRVCEEKGVSLILESFKKLKKTNTDISEDLILKGKGYE